MIDEQKVIGLLQAKALGCIDADENASFQEFVDAGYLFPWVELGKFQYVASLLPISLQLELPDPELKNRVALKLIKLSEQLRASKIINEDKFEIEEDVEENIDEFTNIDEPVIEPPIEIETEEPEVFEEKFSSDLEPAEVTFNLDEVSLPGFEQTEVSENNIEDTTSFESPFDNLIDESQIDYPQIEEVEINDTLKEPETSITTIVESVVTESEPFVEEKVIESKPAIEEPIIESKPVSAEQEDESKAVDFNKRSVAEKMFKAIEQDFDSLKYQFEQTERKTTRSLLISYIVVAVLIALLIFSIFKFSADISGLKDEIRNLKSKISSSLYDEQRTTTTQYFS